MILHLLPKRMCMIGNQEMARELIERGESSCTLLLNVPYPINEN